MSRSQQVEQKVPGSTKMMCRFFVGGGCHKGEDCPFLHDIRKVPLCNYALTNSCRFGAKCAYVHGKFCKSCEKYCLHPYDKVQAQAHQVSCGSGEQGKKECGICLEKIEQFGILANCNHSFCLTCIKEWRAGNSERKRACPMCREESYYVIPSRRWYSNDTEKKEIVSEYKEVLSKTKCKYFEESGRTECPFGESCFYAHLNSDGTPATVVRRPKKKRRGTSADFLNNMESMLALMAAYEDYSFLLDDESDDSDRDYHIRHGFYQWRSDDDEEDDDDDEDDDEDADYGDNDDDDDEDEDF